MAAISFDRGVTDRRTSDHLDRHSEIDYHKEDQLKKQKEGKGHWKKELASNSESAVSDRSICDILLLTDTY